MNENRELCVLVTEDDIATADSLPVVSDGFTSSIDLGTFVHHVDDPGIVHIETETNLVAFLIPVNMWQTVGGSLWALQA